MDFVSIGIQIGGLFLLGAATALGLNELKQIRNTRNAEFLRDFKSFMLDENHMKIRRKIYCNVPHPFAESKAHGQWLSKLRTKKSRFYLEIENEIYTVDWLAYMIRMSKLEVDLVLEQWFDVIARLTLLLHRFIQSEIESRKSTAYVENFRWLARENVKYIRDKRYYLNPPVTLIRAPRKTNVPISLVDLQEAVKVLAGNPTVT